VTRSVYVDTSWLVALIDKRDQHQSAAIALAGALERDDTFLVSTDAVVLELCNYFARSPLREEVFDELEASR
jgi:predicted nucleic acid-binding protein